MDNNWILDVIAIVLSTFALIFSCRRAQRGEFIFTSVDSVTEERIILRLVSLSVCYVKFDFDEKEVDQIFRIKIMPNGKNDNEKRVLFSNITNSCAQIEEGSLIEISASDWQLIKISYEDEYSNKFTQLLTHSGISRRKHSNWYRLSFSSK